MASKTGSNSPITTTTTRTKINFNGTTYERVDAMPHDVRQLYERVLKAAEGGAALSAADIAELSSVTMGGPETTRAAAPHDAGKIRVEASFSARKLILSALMLLLLAAFYYVLKHK